MRPRFVRRGDEVQVIGLILPQRDELHPGNDWVPQSNVRMPADVDGESSPLPVNYSAFAGVGKITSNRWVRTVLDIPGKLAIRASEVNGSAIMGKAEPGSIVLYGSVGGQLPIRERTNIEQPEQTTYGALATLRPDPVTSPQYAKIS